MKLLKMLSDDAHISLRKMGREVGLSTSGVRRRVKQLERSGLIKQYSEHARAHSFAVTLPTGM